MTAVIVVAGLVLLLLLALAVSYNRFVRQRNLVQESWRQVDVELTRRHELIPNLIETVKGYAAHERTVLAGLVEAREELVSTFLGLGFKNVTLDMQGFRSGNLNTLIAPEMLLRAAAR